MSILYDRQDRIARITLNRPDAQNAIDPETDAELARTFQEIMQDPDVWVVIVTGAGEKAFCSGADLKKLIPMTTAMGVGESVAWRQRPESWHSVMARVSKPIVGALNGSAFGGGLELALLCDIRIAAEHASFGLTEVSWGIIPGWGGTQRLPRLIGPGRAMELILTARRIDAREALQIGLVNQVVPGPQVLPAAEEVARTIASRGPLAVRFAKEAILKGLDMSLDLGLATEAYLSTLLRQTEDSREGPRAFAEKRPPRFTGR
ncbi:MAG: enoyl-CoA hydratase/isomerase family protein [Deltaproteobacteria bacterium]|nr:enoyl-CoA hydratase/isomerase family protein [Deltaproteobacteria bacterium]MBI3079130.1 enoyl-CoA hydratase/isomerase family protein [Deltaproteobacteria bacterium]